MRHEYIWGICTGEVEKLLQDEKSPAPGQGAASGGIQSCKTKMRPTDETYLANLTLSDGGKALPPGRAPRRGERANRFEESIISILFVETVFFETLIDQLSSRLCVVRESGNGARGGARVNTGSPPFLIFPFRAWLLFIRVDAAKKQ